MNTMLLFDLDGTISDPLVGIARSINHSLRHFGFDEIPDQDLAWCIGPPIDQNFSRLVGTDSAELIDAMIEKYRERFSDVGYSENTIYPGIREVLTELYDCGIPMGVCTSKRADYARRILEMFELDGFFRFVDGGDVGISKVEQIERLLADGSITGETIMIGDRSHDIIAAHSNGLAATGVLWGYGSREELEAERPSRLLEEVRELGVFRAGARGKG